MDKNKVERYKKFTPLTGQKWLFDGIETNLKNVRFEIQVDQNKVIMFNSSDFCNYLGKDFEFLREEMSDAIFYSIIQEFDFKLRNPPSLGYYKTEQHLSLEYFVREHYLFIFTFGEKQPSRFILVLEGILEMFE
ncbi:hypothetical protein [Dyadobacter sp. 32]|uniref:hypothetical protein n=1 Tax=Dyadobacter sp. 32 TaxID=538966 RepID=UPI0011EF89CC